MTFNNKTLIKSNINIFRISLLICVWKGYKPPAVFKVSCFGGFFLLFFKSEEITY